MKVKVEVEVLLDNKKIHGDVRDESVINIEYRRSISFSMLRFLRGLLKKNVKIVEIVSIFSYAEENDRS